MLYDLGLWKLSRGHCDIPDNAGATGATRLPRRESSKWNVCFKDMTCFTRPQKQSRHSGFVPRQLLTRLPQNNSLWFCFFEKYGADLVCAAQRRTNSYKAGRLTTQLTCNMMQKWTLCFCIVFWSKKTWWCSWKSVCGLTAMHGQTKGDISGLLWTRSEATAALFQCRDDRGPN